VNPIHIQVIPVSADPAPEPVGGCTVPGAVVTAAGWLAGGTGDKGASPAVQATRIRIVKGRNRDNLFIYVVLFMGFVFQGIPASYHRPSAFWQSLMQGS